MHTGNPKTHARVISICRSDQTKPICGFGRSHNVNERVWQTKQTQGSKTKAAPGFALVITLSLMVLITLIATALLSLASIELRKSSSSEARSAAMSNARLGLMLALGQLQKDLGDDRRVTADASILQGTSNPAAVGVWNGWSPDLVSKSASASAPRVDYAAPKGQSGFRGWLVSQADPAMTRQLGWHTTSPASEAAELFTEESSGFELGAEKVPVTNGGIPGSLAWAVTQENTRAKINLGTDDENRTDLDDRLQAPARPNLALSSLLKQPEDGWAQRPATVVDFLQASLDPAYGADRETLGQAREHFTAESQSLLTNVVKGGLKVDLSTGFEMGESDFNTATWSDSWGSVANPFRSDTPREYKGQKPLFQPLVNSAQAQVFMSFEAASVNHKFQVNGVPTFDMLRSHYRSYRHLYEQGGQVTAFERPYAHIATPSLVTGRPYGRKTHASVAPVLDRMNLFFSVIAKADGTLGILLTPMVTIWNPYNVDVETEGVVVYPWIDFAIFWNWSVTKRTPTPNTPNPENWSSSLSRFVGEGYQDHGRSSRPYFYLHLTETGQPVTPRSTSVNPKIRLQPGEVKVFCLADTSRRDLLIQGNAQQRTWRMKAVTSANDITSAMRGGIVLDMTKSIGGTANFNYKLKAGDIVNQNIVEFDRSTYHYIVNMADSWHIKNPSGELMVESRPAGNGLPALPEEKNLYFYGQIHSANAFGKNRDSINYPSYRFEDIRDNPKLIGSLLTYHRVAQTSPGNMAKADLMFTTNPRQPYVTQYLSGARLQTGPHYETLMHRGTSLADLAMETTFTGQQAFYGPSHSASSGRSHLAFFEIPRSPTLSLAAFQHCDLTATAFGNPSQVGNSWASPYLPAASASRRVTTSPNGERITPSGLGVYDMSYLANEALFDGFFLSGAVPETGDRQGGSGSTSIWDQDQLSTKKPLDEVLSEFFENPAENPLRNPRMLPYPGGQSPEDLKQRLGGPAGCARIAAHLTVDGGFNINSTSEEAWAAIFSSLRGLSPGSGNETAQSRFRHVLTGAPANMAANDPWSGFRTLSDQEIQTLARNLVTEIRTRGPFLSLGEFVNRRVSSDRTMNLAGALQSAIDKSNLNKKFTYSTFDTTPYPNRENLPNPNTGTNTPGWLTQADMLHALAPFITPRSDTFVIRSQGEARDDQGKLLATVCLEAVVQRVPDWIDPTDKPETEIDALQSEANKAFGRRFEILQVRELNRSVLN